MKKILFSLLLTGIVVTIVLGIYEHFKNESYKQNVNNLPHKDIVINNHIPKISCQTCHIPGASTENLQGQNMIYSKENSPKCRECHTVNNSRLAGLNNIYMTARDSNKFIEFAGVILIIFSFIGILIHGTMRIILNLKKKKYN